MVKKMDKSNCSNSDQHFTGRYSGRSTALDGLIFTVVSVAIVLVGSALLPGCSRDLMVEDSIEEEIEQHVRDHHKVVNDPQTGHHVHISN